MFALFLNPKPLQQSFVLRQNGIADAIAEVRYSLRSISINASDGRVLDANVNTIGSERFCGGRTDSSTILKAYAELRIASKTFNGIGECRRKADFPERGINEFHCSLDLSAPDDQYLGGLMTTSAVTSLKNVGLESDPSGYTQTSIATIRIWKKRSQH